jgi:hypothetical protein
MRPLDPAGWSTPGQSRRAVLEKLLESELREMLLVAHLDEQISLELTTGRLMQLNLG